MGLGDGAGVGVGDGMDKVAGVSKGVGDGVGAGMGVGEGMGATKQFDMSEITWPRAHVHVKSPRNNSLISSHLKVPRVP